MVSAKKIYYEAILKEDRYLFIDAAHLREHYEAHLNEWLGAWGRLDYDRIRWSAEAKKAFFYDCTDNDRRADETAEAHKARVELQDQLFESIQRLPGFHVRSGWITGKGRNKRQKAMDVQLAVDMLHHAIRGNMKSAVLITGDADFCPLVDALIDLGTWVNVRSIRRHAARDLQNTADSWTAISHSDLWDWSDAAFKEAHPAGITELQMNEVSLTSADKAAGRAAGLDVYFVMGTEIRCYIPAVNLLISSDDRAKIESYLKLEFGGFEPTA